MDFADGGDLCAAVKAWRAGPREPNTPLIKELTLNYKGRNTVIKGIFLIQEVLGFLGTSVE